MKKIKILIFLFLLFWFYQNTFATQNLIVWEYTRDFLICWDNLVLLQYPDNQLKFYDLSNNNTLYYTSTETYANKLLSRWCYDNKFIINNHLRDFSTQTYDILDNILTENYISWDFNSEWLYYYYTYINRDLYSYNINSDNNTLLLSDAWLYRFIIDDNDDNILYWYDDSNWWKITKFNISTFSHLYVYEGTNAANVDLSVNFFLWENWIYYSQKNYSLWWYFLYWYINYDWTWNEYLENNYSQIWYYNDILYYVNYSNHYLYNNDEIIVEPISTQSVTNYWTWEVLEDWFWLIDFQVSSTWTLTFTIYNYDTEELFEFENIIWSSDLDIPLSYEYSWDYYFPVNNSYLVEYSFYDWENYYSNTDWWFSSLEFTTWNYYIISSWIWNFNWAWFDINDIEVTETWTINFVITWNNWENIVWSWSVNINENEVTDFNYIFTNDILEPLSTYDVIWTYTYNNIDYNLWSLEFTTEDNLYYSININENCEDWLERVENVELWIAYCIKSNEDDLWIFYPLINNFEKLTNFFTDDTWFNSALDPLINLDVSWWANLDNISNINVTWSGIITIQDWTMIDPIIIDWDSCSMFNTSSLNFLYYSNWTIWFNFSLRDFSILDNKVWSVLDLITWTITWPINSIIWLLWTITPFVEDNKQYCIFWKVKTISFQNYLKDTEYEWEFTILDYLVLFWYWIFIFTALTWFSIFQLFGNRPHIRQGNDSSFYKQEPKVIAEKPSKIHKAFKS